MRRKQALGFTLIELALVILLISIFMGLGLSALGVLQTNRAFSETREKQEKIKDTLVTYLANFSSLPCPDTNPIGGAPPDGLEDRVGGVPPDCVDPPGAAVPGFGVIPYLTLGLSRDDAVDGWDNFFSYQVSLDNGGTPANEEWSLTATPGVPTAFAVRGNAGSITLSGRDAAGAVTPLNNPPPAGLGIAAIIVSHGRNGSGAFTTKGTRNQLPGALADELDNTDANSVFFQREFTDVAPPGGGGTFDDLVLALTPSDLLTPAIKYGALQSATAQARSQVEIIADTAFGQVPVNLCAPPAPPWPGPPIPPGLPLTVTVDPWGQPMNYRADTQKLTPTTPVAGDAFCIWSSGPNRADETSPVVLPGNCPAIAGGDDIGLMRVNYAQLRVAFSAGAPPPCP